jgi:hypothetical protein
VLLLLGRLARIHLLDEAFLFVLALEALFLCFTFPKKRNNYKILIF